MKNEVNIRELLLWRLARGEAEAPPAPRAACLIELSRPWWQTCPERFQAAVERLTSIQVAYAHAMAEQPRSQGYPTPALIVRRVGEQETQAIILYCGVSGDRLRLRFLLERPELVDEQTGHAFEVTLVNCADSAPILVERAERAAEGEYRLEAELPPEAARQWRNLKVTDRMPFRLILRPETGNE